jgi:succinate dehydrogenase assembly factor 2
MWRLTLNKRDFMMLRRVFLTRFPQVSGPQCRFVVSAIDKAASEIAEIDERLRQQHDSFQVTSKDAVNYDEIRRKRMIYRSKQRGWLEVDLLLGSWAEKNVPKLTPAQLDEYDLVLKEQTIDVYNYISGKDPLPPRLQNLQIMKDLQQYALSNKSAPKDPLEYAKFKKENNLT